LIATIHATERGRNGGHVRDHFSALIDHTEWRLCYEAWRVIVTSRYMADELARLFQVPRDKLDVIPNGVDFADYETLKHEDLAEFRRRFAADDEQLVFSVGRLVYEKGMQTLVAAAPEILAEFPSVRFVVAGRGPMLEELRNMATALGVAHRFCFTGYISDAERDRLYRVADVAVFPSLYEPFGIVVLEAMAAGTPVVAAGVGGLAEIVELHETGMTHYAGNAESLAWAVRHTLRHPEWAAARARNALRRIREVYNWPYIAERTLEVYERVVRERQQVVW
jgi:glycosyltransferase involved in cell wall biosynthesis